MFVSFLCITTYTFHIHQRKQIIKPPSPAPGIRYSWAYAPAGVRTSWRNAPRSPRNSIRLMAGPN